MPSATAHDRYARRFLRAIGSVLCCLLVLTGAVASRHGGFDCTSANELYDFKMPPFQQWLRENHYLRQPSEGDTDFCCRVYLARASVQAAARASFTRRA